MLINSGSNLYDPETVKTTIAKKHWKNGTKMQVAYAYDALTKMLKIIWTMPTYKQEETLPFIPEQQEIDALIHGARSGRLTAYLQTLKETMADPSEALRLRWIDLSANTITINMPVKNHYPRQIPVSNKLIAMLNAPPKNSERIFQTTYRNIAQGFMKVRRKVSQNLQNPRILKISLNTYRHWGATMLYHQTRDILLVKKLLGHKNIQNTLKYTQLIEFIDDEYEETTASTVEQARELGKAGWIKYDEFNGIHLYRKPKRFVG
jgi:integrase